MFTAFQQLFNKLPEFDPFCLTCPQWFLFSWLAPICYIANSKADLSLVFFVFCFLLFFEPGVQITSCFSCEQVSTSGPKNHVQGMAIFSRLSVTPNFLVQLRIGQPRSWWTQVRVGSLGVERTDNWGRTTKRFEQSYPNTQRAKTEIRNPDRNQWQVVTVGNQWGWKPKVGTGTVAVTGSRFQEQDLDRLGQKWAFQKCQGQICRDVLTQRAEQC